MFPVAQRIMAGSVFEWYAKQFGDFKKPFDLEDCMENLINDARKVPAGSEGLIFLPYLQGERAPIWNANARGVYFGLNIKHEQQHFIRATIEGILYAIYSIGKTLEEHRTIKSLSVQRQLCFLSFLDTDDGRYFQQAGSYQTKFGQCCLGGFLVSATEMGIYKNLDEAAQTVELLETYTPQNNIIIFT